MLVSGRVTTHEHVEKFPQNWPIHLHYLILPKWAPLNDPCWKILMFYSKRKYIKTNQPYNSTWVRDCLHFKKPCSNMCCLLFVHISTPRMLRHSSRYLLSISLCQRMKHWDLDELRKAETELQEMRISKQKIINNVLKAFVNYILVYMWHQISFGLHVFLMFFR